MPRESVLDQNRQAVGQAGYVELIRENHNFRHLWLGNVVSLLGDWFNTIALYQLVDHLTGSPFALGAVFISKMLPWALASPVAGLIVDRFDRRRVMIFSDLIRAAIVLGFLFIYTPGEVYLVYVLTTLQVVVGAVFQPAQASSIPNITTRRQLLTANALMSATWSVLLAFGAAVGGVITEVLGIRPVFVIHSLTYLVSASFIYRTVIPQEKEHDAVGPIVRTAFRQIGEGWNYLINHPRIGRISFAKASWSLGGSGLVYMLVLLSEEISPGAQALAIGVLYAARGVGTGIGPVIARAWFRDRRYWPAIIGLAIGASGLSYLFVGFLPFTYWLAIFVTLAHTASGVNWMLATVMLQERAEDRYRGRVFATEWLLVMTAEALSTLIASLLLEAGIFDLRGAFAVFASIQILSGLAWIALIVPQEMAATVEAAD